MAAFSASDEGRGLLGILVVAFRIRVSPAGNEPVGLGLEGARFGEILPARGR